MSQLIEDLKAYEREAQNAKRYIAWRDAMIAGDTGFLVVLENALPPDVGLTRRPTPEEWDAALDATIKAQGEAK